MEITKSEYFKRQTTLAEIGEQGQEKLQNAKVLIIGCGGLGSPIAIYLATSGVGALHLVDFDNVSVTNLHRQVFFKKDDVQRLKVNVLASEIQKRTPFTKVSVTSEAIDKNSIISLISHFDVVVDATDNLQVKYLINDACVVAKKPLVYGSLYKFDGYVATFNMLQSDGTYTCNLRDAFPTIATEIPNCETAGTMNPIVGLIAMLQTNEVVKLITNTGKLITNQLLIYNVLTNTQFKMKLKKNESINVEEIFRNSIYEDKVCETQDKSILITASELSKKLDDPSFKIVSVINNLEANIPFNVHSKIPYKEFDINKFEPNFEKNYVIVCAKGISSYDVTLKIKTKFPNLHVYSLAEGIENY
ncbi:molybdopterin biosynthesis protein MoeB [Lutibacter sp. HS1-25]|uniref:HesA/MoeB/ThiF family protein n=1 Tax=Lutibacter sp. HS1-25 TaxID=2485000 RepID=UPI0010102349|nr:HesA/MoeB/ThiF family protein [Lutibacter sp. HS1-25]RXP44585.1 molybdopterin biosynthesis protein MoeB [Lutibacter sp. HS1-25]